MASAIVNLVLMDSVCAKRTRVGSLFAQLAALTFLIGREGFTAVHQILSGFPVIQEPSDRSRGWATTCV